MNTKLCGIIFSTVILLELTSARTVTHHETIINSNGDKIERSWTTYESDEAGLNKNYSKLLNSINVFEDDKNAWDMEPNPESEPELEPQPQPAPELEPEPEPELQPEPESAESKEAEHDWKSRKLDDPMEIQPKPTNIFSHTFNSNGFEMWPVRIQQPIEQETPYNINRMHVTQTYSSKPTQTHTQTQTVRTVSYSGPQTVFTGVWPNMVGGWPILNENPKQPSWQNMSPKPYPVGDEKTVQKPENTNHSKPTVMVQSAIYPNKSLDDLVAELFRDKTATTTKTTTTTTTTTTPRLPPTPTPPPPPPRRTTPSTTTTPKPQPTSYQSNIEKFLNKVDLSKNDIQFQTAARTIKKTIIDDNGDILTATFMLSSVKDNDTGRNKQQIEVKPVK